MGVSNPLYGSSMQPMRTAPQDEAIEILAFHETIGFTILTWIEGFGFCSAWDHDVVEIEDFKGWWPLPPEPK